jgi:hypothetical protein
MLLFRSEDHLGRWLDSGKPRGSSMTVQQQWELATRWFAGRADADWIKRSPEEVQAVFEDVGLTGDFWRFD